MTDKNKIAGHCPFCGGQMEIRRGIYGDPYFRCQNAECSAWVSFPTIYTDDAVIRRFRRRAGGKRPC